MSTAGERLRRAALTVHALPEGDRAWLLGQLAPADRAALGPLLRELESLGIPADPALLAPVLARASGDGADRLAGADPARLANLLAVEPELFVARLLHVREWPWRAALLEAWPAPRRQRVVADLRRLQGGHMPAAPRLAAAIVAEVTQRLGDSAPPPAPPAVPARRWWQRFGARR